MVMKMNDFRKAKCWFLALLLLDILPANAQVSITELMPCNTSTYINDLYDFAGYAELYNDTDEDVDLKGYVFENQKKNGDTKWSWVIDKECVVKSKSYRVVFFDEVEDTRYHVGYKLDTDGGTLLLKSDSSVVSSMKYTQQYPHLSYGIDKDSILGYMEPSPMEDNTTAYESIKNRCDMPKFGVAPGVQTKVIELDLECTTKDAKIYYTLNGSTPTLENGILYKEPILIEGNAVVRARSFKKDMLPSAIATGSYLYADALRVNGFSTPIVSVVTDSVFYYDDMIGMYVDGKNGKFLACVGKKNYVQDWTRPANFEYIVDGKVVVNQEVETSIKGVCTRNSRIKSLGIKANKKSGKKGFDYTDFFSQRPNTKYDDLHLRNGGNAFSTTRWRDGFLQTIAGHIGLDYQAYEPVVCFIDGKLLGLMGLRENLNKSYIKANYNLDEEEIDLLKIAQEPAVAMTGTRDAYDSLIVELGKDPVSDDYFQNISNLMDVEEYLDYQVFEQFVVNTDWPGNNQKIWRERNNGKFRWIVYDLDFGLGLYETVQTSDTKRDFNMLNQALGADLDSKDEWKSTPFKQLMKNDEFKYRFLIKFLHHMKYSFTESTLDSLWSVISAKVSDEYLACQLGSRNADADARKLLDFAKDRPEYVLKHLQEYYKGGNIVSLQIVAKDAAGKRIPNSSILVNNEFVGTTDYTNDYFTKVPLKVKIQAPAGYKFQKWTLSSTVTEAGNTPHTIEVFNGKLTNNIKMTAYFTTETDPKPLTLQINEVCSSNNSELGNPDECGHYSDWIEIHNYGEEDIDLAGMYITDNSSNNMKYMFPFGYSETVVKAGGYLIVWADNESWRGPLHTNFKISASGSFIGLSYYEQDELVYLDKVRCPNLLPNDTYGRIGDGNEHWAIFSTVDGESQVTFGSKNNIVDYEPTAVVQPVSIQDAITLYPNPANNEITIQTIGQNSKIISLAIYNTQGVMLRSISNINEPVFTLPIESLNSGMYILKAETNGAVTHKKFEKQ